MGFVRIRRRSEKRPTNLTVLADKLMTSSPTGTLSTIRTKIVNRREGRISARPLAGLRIRHARVWLGLGAAAAIAIVAGVWFRLRTLTAEDDVSFYDHLYDISSCLA